MTTKALLFGLCCASGWLGTVVSMSTTPRETMKTSAQPETVASPFVQSLPPLPPKSRRLVLLRHGETDWNSQGLLQGGGYDVELNEAGRKQAVSAAQQLLGLSSVSVVASSHLERSSQTADVLSRTAFPDAVRVISHKFGEMRFGEFEGLQIRRGDQEGGGARNEEVEAQRRKFLDLNNILHENKHVAWPGGGESVADVEKRGQEGIQQLLRSFPDCNQFCIVAHGRFNKLLLMSLLGMSGKSNVFQQGNACINVLDVNEKGHWKACVVNHMEHIHSATARQSPS